MCRIVVRAKDSFGPDRAKHHRGHQRGDVIDILEDGRHVGIEVDAKDLWRVIEVPGYPVLAFLWLLEQERPRNKDGTATGAHKKKWRLDIDEIEARATVKKGSPLGAMDTITIPDKSEIERLASVKVRPFDRFLIG